MISPQNHHHSDEWHCIIWRGGRVAEGAPLLREYRLIPYRGFESLSLRQILILSIQNVQSPTQIIMQVNLIPHP